MFKIFSKKTQFEQTINCWNENSGGVMGLGALPELHGELKDYVIDIANDIKESHDVSDLKAITTALHYFLVNSCDMDSAEAALLTYMIRDQNPDMFDWDIELEMAMKL